jgi:hypothetical protein
LDANHATMEEMHLKEEHTATSPPIVVTVDGKDPASTLTHYQACVQSRFLCSLKHSFTPRIATFIISYVWINLQSHIRIYM